jgi:hypothetical protein
MAGSNYIFTQSETIWMSKIKTTQITKHKLLQTFQMIELTTESLDRIEGKECKSVNRKDCKKGMNQVLGSILLL